MSIVLVDMTGGRLVQMDLDLNFPLVAASIVDPMIAVLTENGRLMLFELGNDLQLRTVPISTGFNGLAPITAICLYRYTFECFVGLISYWRGDKFQSFIQGYERSFQFLYRRRCSSAFSIIAI